MAVSYQTFTNKLCQLWSCWTKVHKIFTRYIGNIYAVNAHIEVAISHSVSECQSDGKGEFAIFFTKLVAMAKSLRYRKKGADRSSAPKRLSFGEKTVKIGPADPEIIVL